MLTGIDLSERIEFSLPEDQNNPTIFVLGPLTARQKLHLFSFGTKEQGGIDEFSVMKNPEILFEIAVMGVRAIKNFQGKDWIEPVDQELNRFSPAVISTVAAKILEISFLSGEERKN